MIDNPLIEYPQRQSTLYDEADSSLACHNQVVRSPTPDVKEVAADNTTHVPRRASLIIARAVVPLLALSASFRIALNCIRSTVFRLISLDTVYLATVHNIAQTLYDDLKRRVQRRFRDCMLFVWGNYVPYQSQAERPATSRLNISTRPRPRTGSLLVIFHALVIDEIHRASVR
jgi:hypothetical protein